MKTALVESGSITRKGSRVFVFLIVVIQALCLAILGCKEQSSNDKSVLYIYSMQKGRILPTGEPRLESCIAKVSHPDVLREFQRLELASRPMATTLPLRSILGTGWIVIASPDLKVAFWLYAEGELFSRYDSAKFDNGVLILPKSSTNKRDAKILAALIAKIVRDVSPESMEQYDMFHHTDPFSKQK